MQGDDPESDGGNGERRADVRRFVRGSALAIAGFHALLGAVLLYGLYAPEPAVLKVAAYALIGWGPVATLLSYSDMDDRWGNGRELWATVSANLIIATLAFLAWYLG